MSRARKKAIVRVTPTLGMVSHWWCQAAERLLSPMNTVKGAIFMTDEVGGMIAEGRNAAVQKVLGTFESADVEVDSIFWLDDDVICSPGAIRQLYHHDVPIASGVYFTKEPGIFSQPLIFPGRCSGVDKFVPAKDGEQRAYKVWGHGMGLALVKAEVYRRMRDELDLGTDCNGNPMWYRTTSGELKVEGDCVDMGGTEDMYFLDLASKLGYEPLIDCSKYAFGFHYCSSSRKGYPEPQWNQYVAALGGSGKPIEWPQPDGSVIEWR